MKVGDDGRGELLVERSIRGEYRSGGGVLVPRPCPAVAMFATVGEAATGSVDDDDDDNDADAYDDILDTHGNARA